MAATWSIEPQVEGVTITNEGKLTYPANLTETTFTVKYDDGEGCSGEYVYRVPESCGDNPPEPEICSYFIVDSGKMLDVEASGGGGCDSAWIAAEGKPMFIINGVPSDKCDWIEINQYIWGKDDRSKMCSWYDAYPSVAQRLMVLAKIDEAASEISTDGCRLSEEIEWSKNDNELCIQPLSDKKTDPYFVDKGVIRPCQHPLYPTQSWEYHPPKEKFPTVVQQAIDNEGDYAYKLGAIEYTVKENTTGKKRECIIEWYVDDIKCKSKQFRIVQKG